VLIGISSRDGIKASSACLLGKGIKILDKRGIGYSDTGVIVEKTPLAGLGIHGNFTEKKMRIEGVYLRVNVPKGRVLKYCTVCQGDRRTTWSRKRGGLG